MSDMLWLVVTAFAISCLATWQMLHGARRWEVLDRPNERSSHQQPTPTLGGLGIAAGVWTGMGWYLPAEPYRWPLLASTLILLITIKDDLGQPLRPAEKLGVLLVAAIVWLWWGPHLEWVTLPWIGPVALGAWSGPLTGLWLLWLCNVYNFMDGIDGISATQTIGAGAWLAVWTWAPAPGLAGMALAALAAAAGFLVFNFPPARIFMGDVGALFLGFWLALIGVLGERAGLPLWIAALPLGGYLFDTSYTLVRRALRGENLLQAHRTHLYQRLTRLGFSHLRVDLGLLLLILLLGGGGHACLHGMESLGAVLLGTAGALMIGVAIWIERKAPLG